MTINKIYIIELHYCVLINNLDLLAPELNTKPFHKLKSMCVCACVRACVCTCVRACVRVCMIRITDKVTIKLKVSPYYTKLEMISML